MQQSPSNLHSLLASLSSFQRNLTFCCCVCRTDGSHSAANATQHEDESVHHQSCFALQSGVRLPTFCLPTLQAYILYAVAKAASWWCGQPVMLHVNTLSRITQVTSKLLAGSQRTLSNQGGIRWLRSDSQVSTQSRIKYCVCLLGKQASNTMLL